jgi:hypothetical protein
MSPYQLAHAPLGCEAICALVVDTHLTGSAAQSVFSICSCQAHGKFRLGCNQPFPSNQSEITEKGYSYKQMIIFLDFFHEIFKIEKDILENLYLSSTFFT